MALNIIIDSAIPYIKGILEPYADVRYIKGAEISREDVSTADALIVRTRTKCDRTLLEDSPVSMIATATIGTDHIDFDYCASRNIEVASAPGCNSSGVCQWVYAALKALSLKRNISMKGQTIGVVGVGNVGRKVAGMASRFGLEVLQNDPPRALREGPEAFVTLDELLSDADIVTLHIPLSEQTHNFASDDFFRKMKPGAIFINASRGEVVDEDALIANMGNLGGVALDVWKNEPLINRDLMNRVDIATPHIAGYSAQGKINGTNMALRAVCTHFGLPELLSTMGRGFQGDSVEEIDVDSYDIMSDNAALRSNCDNFELLRNNYNYR